MTEIEDDPPTCGRGLAANSAVPAKMSELIATLADNLEKHLPTIDLSDPSGVQERNAYLDLLTAFREVSSRLGAAAERMAGYRDLPMAPHLEEAFADPGILASFAKYVQVQEQLLTLLTDASERDRRMLAAFGDAGGTSS